ncbi:prodrug activation and resistance esterase [Plasmodium brasilianum]|uniref:Lysophospholipase, putative n=2 Tax=Plasmodium (Plasmodium) TaxID=418103 RepID=A0A1A8VPZ9_PLAMA|nr:lysophospholipase, putative [Plasmodium malariae]KAI4841235.1 prodrug activation and resistance esterase [Plasmodium brasilianum]SBS81399.1 lysophospholipase, putative [Plasmodium malariae]SBT86921.1 lysophospholipase, putative [Plasmodium malariae]
MASVRSTEKAMKKGGSGCTLAANLKLDGKPKVDSFNNKDGLSIKTYSWQVKDPQGIMFLVHGLNTHVRLEYLRHNVEIEGNNERAVLKDADNYYIYKGSWIEHLNKQGYSVYGLDLQGHGQSDGWKNLKTNVKKFDDIVYDVLQYINRVHDTLCLSHKRGTNGSIHDNITNTKIPPFYIMGLSMGGNIVLRILEILGKSKDSNNKLNIRGCISLAGMISIDELATKASYKYFYIPFSKFFATFFPSLRISPTLHFKKFPYINDIFHFDKNRYNKAITCKLGYELLSAIENLNNDMVHLPKNIPILFIHSKQDSACFFGGVQTFYNKIDSDKKELHILEDMDHVLTMEPGNEQVLKKVIEWLSNVS